MFILQSYPRKELAQLYFPGLNPRSAYMNLRNWLLEHKDTHPEQLKQIHGRRILRKCDVALIVELIGEP
ncbi:MAG: hypothetical protein BGO70_16605 [Bacteroidetes bacterium 43-93]|nr:DUF4248 domain-containing protein [Bacteroidota bacterium]OJX01384.1 MAG: hypothetical protein BGO70_16605 [Bacteroidetes bacterium 43-93]